jgi:pimeloyl-ACP methyl ester carboxylesterase
MQVVVSDLITSYIREGKGESLLFLHGWGDSSKTFLNLINDLKDDFDCIAVDLPGFGNTQLPPKAWSLDDYAKFVESFLNKIGINNLGAIIAHSNGGAITIRSLSLGLLAPKKVILIAASGVRNINGGRKKMYKLIAKTGKGLTFWLPKKQKESLKRRLYGSIGSDMLVVPELKETYKNIINQDVQADAAKVTQPSLLIYGSGDDSTPLSFGERYVKLMPNSKLEVVDSGHFVHQEQTQKVIEMIKGFLK